MESDEREPKSDGEGLSEPEPEPRVHNETSGKVGRDNYQAESITINNVGEVIRSLPPRVWVEPNDLPSEYKYFVDREWAYGQVTTFVTDPDNTSAPAIVISALHGVGSSAFAIHWGNRERGRYPDGNLYANLDDHRVDEVVSPKTILTQWLLSCGVQKAELANDLQGLKDQFRRLTRGRRILAVADHARNEAEVSELCPPSPGSALIATSFRMDKFVLDMEHIPLKPLSPVAARQLVLKLIGAERAEAEPDAVTELIGLCDGVPLVLKLALARMRRDDDITVADVVDDMKSDLEQSGAARDRESILDAIASRAYESLPAGAAFLYRRLAWHPGPDISKAVIDALGGHHGFNAKDALDTLLDLHLLYRNTSKRYRILPALRAYAQKRSRAADGEDAENRALAVWSGWYVAQAQAADRRITPDRNRVIDQDSADDADRDDNATANFETPELARDWFDAERHNLLAIQRQCWYLGWFERVLRLGEPMWLMYIGNRDIPAFLESMRLAVDAAVALGDLAAEVRFRPFRARALMEDGQYEAAGRELALARDRSKVEGIASELCASAIEFTGRLFAYQEQYGDAVEQYRLAKTMFAAEAERTDVPEANRRANRRGVALQYHFIGRCLLKQGHAREAAEQLRLAESTMAGKGRERDLATIRTDLSEALRLSGDLDEAFATITAAVGLLAYKDWYRIEAEALWQLVYVAEARGDSSLQRDGLERLRNLYEQTGEERIAEVTQRLSGLDDG